MIGQGSPSSSPIARARDAPLPLRPLSFLFLQRVIGFALLLGAIIAPHVAAQENATSTPVRLRLSWGGGPQTAWRGRIWLDNGVIAQLRHLGSSADSAGSIWLENGQIRIASLSQRDADAIEIVANADETSRLFVELVPPAATPPITPTTAIQIPLVDVLRRSHQLRLDKNGNTLKVEHCSEDQLAILFENDKLIFSPGEKLSMELRPQLPDMEPGTSIDIMTTLSAARGNQTVWSEPQRLQVPVEGTPRIAIDVPLPQEEGVYTVHVAASRPPGFRPRFFPGSAAPTAERTVDVVVIDPNPALQIESEQWEPVLDLDPTSPGWWDRLPAWTQLRRIPGINLRHVGSTRAATVELPFGRFVELPATPSGGEAHWQAYSLPVEIVGMPHLLEIEYPENEEQHFSLSIVEPNAAGTVESIGRDGGVYVESFGRGDKKRVHRTVFWPRTQVPTLLVTNQHASAVARYGHIRVSRRNGTRLTSAPALRAPTDRLVAAYVAKPLLPETFNATTRVVKLSSEPPTDHDVIHDWQSLYEGATRLSEFVRYGGYNSAVVNVLAEGSSIYPSAYIAPTPRYSSSRRDTNSPERDALELLLCVFDRDGLALLPAIQFAAPLPALEELRRTGNPQASGLEWIGPNGKTWVEVHGTTRGLAPYYNVLDERVQQSMLDVVREIIERYDRHPSLAGLAIQLSATGYAQLPPLDWGLDDATIARFRRDTGIQITASGPTRFADRHAVLTGEHAEAWRTWRNQRLKTFYSRMAETLGSGVDGNKRRLILSLEESFNSPQLAARVRPVILPNAVNRVENALLDAGIDRARLESIPGVVVSATRYVESMSPLSDRAIDLELNDAFAGWQKPEGSNHLPAAMLYHRPHVQQITMPPIGSLKFAGPLTIVSQPSAYGPAVRKPYARAIVQHDPAILIDGGETLQLGQADELRSVREIMRQLPTDAKIEEIDRQPVTARSYVTSDGVILLIVNASAWPATANITLDVPHATSLDPLTTSVESSSQTSSPLAAGKKSWSISLEPYGVQAMRSDATKLKVVDLVALPNDDAKRELAARLLDIENRDLLTPRLYNALKNPSFEPLNGAGQIEGWRVNSTAANAEMDATDARDGTTCAHFKNQTGSAVLESEPFASPPTGQLGVTVLIRGHRMSSGSELRIAIESANTGRPYRRVEVIPPPAAGQEDNWYARAILVNDLPLENRGELRVRFEMTGPGEVCLDGVRLFDLLFPLTFYTNVEAERLQFVQWKHAAKRALDEGRIVDCTRTMERYWPRFLVEYTPRIQTIEPPPSAGSPDSPLASPSKRTNTPTPGVSELLKRLPFMK